MVNRKHDEELQDDIDFTNEDSVSIDPELEEVDEQSLDKIKKLRADLKVCHEERQSIQEELQRNRADFLNARKRQEEQLGRDRERITIKHIEELLPIVDSFDMAINDPKWPSADPVWRKGMEGVYAQLMAVLKSYDVTAISPLGETFNPHEHEALTDSNSNDIIAGVMQKGSKR